MRRTKGPAPIALGSLAAMAGLLAMGSIELAHAQGTWATRTDMPTARWELATCVVDGMIYAIGGASSTLKASRAVEVYDPATDTWTTRSEMPTARQGLSASVVNGRIYAIGGGSCTPSVDCTSVPTVEEYDPATDAWRTLSPMTAPRHSAQAGVIGDVVYVAAGSPSIGRTYTDVHEGFSFAFE